MLDDDEAIEAWNTRPLEDALRAELAAKDAEIERLRGVMQVAVDYLFDVSSVSVHSEWKMFVEAKRLLFQALQKGKPHEQAHT
jgi:hypothetical protein